VYDWNRWTTATFMGRASVNLSSLPTGNEETRTLSLQAKSESDYVTGTLTVSFIFNALEKEAAQMWLSAFGQSEEDGATSGKQVAETLRSSTHLCRN
jgi:Ca2+-dependent lipid-binding protein